MKSRLTLLLSIIVLIQASCTSERNEAVDDAVTALHAIIEQNPNGMHEFFGSTSDEEFRLLIRELKEADHWPLKEVHEGVREVHELETIASFPKELLSSGK
jgi:hypothetical protein